VSPSVLAVLVVYGSENGHVPVTTTFVTSGFQRSRSDNPPDEYRPARHPAKIFTAVPNGEALSATDFCL